MLNSLKTAFSQLTCSPFARDVATRFTKFGAVGLSGFVVDTSVYFMISSVLGGPHNLARVVSYWSAATWNWFWNRQFTFKDGDKGTPHLQWGKYMIMCLISFVPNVGTYYLLTSTVPFFAEYKYLAFIAGIAAGTLFNFTGASVLIFKIYGRR